MGFCAFLRPSSFGGVPVVVFLRFNGMFGPRVNTTEYNRGILASCLRKLFE